ncbi:UNVERIFIED_CONTAM: hypothetical protein HDU68_012265 [Siphonaria sp. JEL0065]|nr:hypothetical protein HDU68_012265 [Siphonaria sp. JEL0065]
MILVTGLGLVSAVASQTLRYRQLAAVDFFGFDLALRDGVPSLDACVKIAQFNNPPARFFTYDASRQSCWAKNPKPRQGFITAADNLQLQDVDFTNYFDMAGSPLYLNNVADCLAACDRTLPCIVVAYLVAQRECYLKTPSGASTAQVTTGYWWIEQPAPCVSTGTASCSASQCGASIRDNCGNSITCPSCPPPPQPGCVSTGTAACSDAQCGLSIFDNCGKTIQCPACSSSTSPSPSANTSTPSNGGVVSTGPSGGMIGGIVGGLGFVIIAVGAFVYSKKGKKATVSPEAIYTKDAQAGFNSFSATDLPVFTGSDLLSSPEAIPQTQDNHCVTSVPGFYTAITDYEPLKDGQLPLTVGQRLYVTSVTHNGWCRALIARQEGWVHAGMLGPIG